MATSQAVRHLLLVGTGTLAASSSSRGVYGAWMDGATGRLSEAWLVAECENPTYVRASAVAPGAFVVAHETREGRASVYAVQDGAAGRPLARALSSWPTGGADPCHVSERVSADGRSAVVFASNYTGGSVVARRVERGTGAAAAQGAVYRPAGDCAAGSMGVPSRQEAPHMHQAAVHAASGRVLVSDLGRDEVLSLEAGEDGRTLERRAAAGVGLGAGPRHLALTPRGSRAVLACELDLTLRVLAVSGCGEVGAELRRVSLGRDAPPGSTAAAVLVSPSDGTVYASVRGADRVLAFSGGGVCAPLFSAPSGGRTPRDLALSPCSRWLVAANQDSDLVCVLSAATGEQVSSAAVPTPMSVAFLVV